MAISLDQVMAAPGATPAAPATPEEAQAGGVHPAAALETLPSEVLDIPAVFAVAKGNPPAISAPDESPDPAVKAITKNAQALVAGGFGIYESRDGKNWVLYNSALVQPGDLIDADVQGKLSEVAPPFNSIGGNASSSGQPATGAAPTAESQPAASVQTNLAVKRQTNLAPGAPTSGPVPGSGRILNNILKPAV
jgi:hypothetical protein